MLPGAFVLFLTSYLRTACECTRYGGSAAGRAKLVAALVKKYGPEADFGGGGGAAEKGEGKDSSDGAKENEEGRISRSGKGGSGKEAKEGAEKEVLDDDDEEEEEGGSSAAAAVAGARARLAAVRLGLAVKRAERQATDAAARKASAQQVPEARIAALSCSHAFVVFLKP